MLNKFLRLLRDSADLERAIIITILAGIIIAAVLVIEGKEENFSSLYIYPDSYTNYPVNDTISFTYGVKSYEKERTGYDFEVFIDDQPVDKKHFEINPGDTHEENETLKLPYIELPAKVNLVLKSPSNTYAVHYWLLRPQDTLLPAETPVVAPAAPAAPAIPAVTPAETPVTPAVTSVTPGVTPVMTPVITPSSAITPAGTVVSDPTSIPVLIDSRRGFMPEKVSIRAGDSVKWVNYDIGESEFTLTSKEDLFTVVLKEGKRFEYQFNTPGTYTFSIKEKPRIKGVVRVE